MGHPVYKGKLTQIVSGKLLTWVLVGGGSPPTAGGPPLLEVRGRGLEVGGTSRPGYLTTMEVDQG